MKLSNIVKLSKSRLELKAGSSDWTVPQTLWLGTSGTAD